jgi:hypothetical protein
MFAASLLAFLAVFAIWMNRQLLETDTWTNTSTELLEDPEIRSQVANQLVDTLYANVDVQGQLAAALPPRLQPLAGPAAGAFRQFATDRANDVFLQRPKVLELWEDANRNAHETLLDVVEHGGDEAVTLDLGTIVTELGDQLGVDVASRIPPEAADIEIASNDQLVKVNKLLKVMRGLAVVLTLLALGLFGLAIYLAQGWRREALRSAGFAFIGVGIAVLVARSLAGDVVVGALASTGAVEPAADSAWSIGTSLLNDQGGGMLFYGIFIVLGAWLAGPTGFARSARRAITPILERRAVAYSALALLIVLLFAWSPTPGFQRLPTALLMIVLLVVGLEFLRGKAVKDFPNETWEGATERWGAALRTRFGGSSQP